MMINEETYTILKARYVVKSPRPQNRTPIMEENAGENCCQPQWPMSISAVTWKRRSIGVFLSEFVWEVFYLANQSWEIKKQYRPDISPVLLLPTFTKERLAVNTAYKLVSTAFVFAIVDIVAVRLFFCLFWSYEELSQDTERLVEYGLFQLKTFCPRLLSIFSLLIGVSL